MGVRLVSDNLTGNLIYLYARVLSSDNPLDNMAKKSKKMNINPKYYRVVRTGTPCSAYPSDRRDLQKGKPYPSNLNALTGADKRKLSNPSMPTSGQPLATPAPVGMAGAQQVAMQLAQVQQVMDTQQRG